MASRESRAKWVGLCAAIWVQASAGNAYMFAFYSPSLKSVLHYNQLQLNNLGVAKDFGENVGLLAGLVSNRLPAWTLLCTGAALGCLGYGALWLVVSEQISPLPYWQMCVLQCIGSNSATWFNTAVLVTCMRNFPHSRGTVVGILKGFVGLSAAIFAQVYTALLSGNASLLLLFLTTVPTAICLSSMLFVRPVQASPCAATQTSGSGEHINFDYITAVCIALAGYLLTITVSEKLVTDMNELIPVALTAVMVLFLVAPLAVPLRDLSYGVQENNASALQKPLLKEDPERNSRESLEVPAAEVEEEDRNEGNVTVGKGTGTTQEEVEDAETLLAVGEGAVKRSKRRPRRGEDFNLRQALVKADFWLLFSTFFCGVGTGVTVINNLGQIGEAQGYFSINIFVSLISIANFLGRLGGGSLSEHYVRSDAIPRTVWMGVAQIMLIFVHLMFASALPGTLYVGSVLLGLCYGVHFSIMVPTASELFGLRHFGMIYNFLTIANPLGSFLFSGMIAGYLYDREAGKDANHLLHKHAACTGPHCFRLTFYVMACVSCVGVVLTAVLTFRIRRVYTTLYRKSSVSDFQSLGA